MTSSCDIWAMTSYDMQPLPNLNLEDFFDAKSVAWYRRLFQDKQSNSHADLSDVDFLHALGVVVEANGSPVPTRAAVLLFGKERYTQQMLPRGLVDYQRIDTPADELSPDRRWDDREVVEGNIVQAWQVVMEKYMRSSDKPFSIDPTTLLRRDKPLDDTSFREATANLLIHRDYSDPTCKSVIKIFTDQTVFWNPGDTSSTVDQLLDSTAKRLRNPTIVRAFRRIGLSEDAGTGMRAIFNNWRELGYIPPVVENDKAEGAFKLVLKRELLVTEPQRLFQSQLGIDLSGQQADVFAYACRSGRITITDATAVIVGTHHEARAVIDHLVTLGLLCPIEDGFTWDVAAHLKDQFLQTDQANRPEPSLITDQADKPEPNLTNHQQRIVELCEVPRKMAELMREIGLTSRVFFQQRHLEPLIQAKLIRMMHPDKPRHPNQTYVVTEDGLRLLLTWKSDADTERDQ